MNSRRVSTSEKNERDLEEPTTAAGLDNWSKELEEIRRRFNTGRVGLTADQILAEDRADRI
jgi:hypothetical protein